MLTMPNEQMIHISKAVVIPKNLNEEGSMWNVINRVWFVATTPIFSKMQI